MVWVFPGCALVLASDLRFISALIREDLPTLDFPANATSIFVFAGNTLVTPHTVSNATFFITIRFSCILCTPCICFTATYLFLIFLHRTYFILLLPFSSFFQAFFLRSFP